MSTLGLRVASAPDALPPANHVQKARTRAVAGREAFIVRAAKTKAPLSSLHQLRVARLCCGWQRRRMKLVAVLAFLLTLSAAADDLLPTLMNTRGKLLVDQPMQQQPPPFDGKSNGFASGFKGWRYNSAERGGHWEVVDGAFKGAENPTVNHPATASYGFDFRRSEER